ncbi:MAG TPA: beta-ketoacyl-ACP synthase II, partial [Thermomicrobiales bacterium]|nr:beta-ketoacyl-ACP synthase II [Thermomicrobiales bacterium]
RYIEGWDTGEFPLKIAGEVKTTPELPWIDAKTARNIARYARFGIAAAGQAWHDANLNEGDFDPERSGVIVGTGAGGMSEIVEMGRTLDDRGHRRVSPHFMTTFPHNMASYHIAQAFRMLGPNSTVSTACATGAQAIADATATIRRGEADLMLAGGAEHSVFPLFVASFIVQKATSPRNDPPEKASRPFDTGRDGFVIGEGAAILVLESLDHALARNATIYAEVLGAGSSSDAYHPIAPEPDGRGAALAMTAAMTDAGIGPDDIDYINAHATSTPLGDIAETKAIKRALGDENASRIAVSATKSMVGHLMGAAGAVEAAVTAMSVKEGRVHPTINLDSQDPECDLDYVANEARPLDIRAALSNSFGLGGQNACLVIGKYTGQNGRA